MSLAALAHHAMTLPRAELKGLVDRSHALVLASLTKKQQKLILGESTSR